MNILITNEGKACLCDFGLSNLMLEFHDPTFYTSTIGANARWAAPEIYRITNDETAPTATTKSDVYSFGCILLEVCPLLAGKLNWPDEWAHRSFPGLFHITISQGTVKFFWSFSTAISRAGHRRGMSRTCSGTRSTHVGRMMLLSDRHLSMSGNFLHDNFILKGRNVDFQP